MQVSNILSGFSARNLSNETKLNDCPSPQELLFNAPAENHDVKDCPAAPDCPAFEGNEAQSEIENA